MLLFKLNFFISVSFKAGLLQPPVRIVSQPQPARRLDPPSRFSGRNDRGDQVPNRKDDRRYVFFKHGAHCECT